MMNVASTAMTAGKADIPMPRGKVYGSIVLRTEDAESMQSFMQKKVQDSMETGSKERISRRSYRYQSTDTNAINAVTIRRKYMRKS